VAYLRFASVYRSFDNLEDFEAEIALLRAEGDPTGTEPDSLSEATTKTSHT
jgi:transcriptional repressor NrdR